MGYISGVCSGGQSCAVLADRNVTGFVSAVHELASRERQFYCWLSRVRKLALAPIRSKGIRKKKTPPPSCFQWQTLEDRLSSAEGASPFLGEPSRLFNSICESFSHLSLLVGRHSAALTYFLQDARSFDVASLPLLTHMEHFLDIYRE